MNARHRALARAIYDTPGRDSIEAAVRAEQDAYTVMRDLIPDLALPLAERAPLTRRQQGAVDGYAQAKERLRLARADHEGTVEGVLLGSNRLS